MAYIESAFYGDEKTTRDVTKVLKDKIFGTSIDVDVNEKIIPPFEVVDKVEITNLEEKKIKEDAVRACGGVDQACIEKTEASLRQQTLAAKQNATEANETLIKGKRLTVNIVDEKGKRIRKVVPDGNKFKYDNLSSGDPSKGAQLPSVSQLQSRLLTLAMMALAALIYVFSVAATYTLSMQYGAFVAVPVTAISIFIPYSGYVMIFFYFMFKTAINTYVGKV